MFKLRIGLVRDVGPGMGEGGGVDRELVTPNSDPDPLENGLQSFSVVGMCLVSEVVWFCSLIEFLVTGLWYQPRDETASLSRSLILPQRASVTAPIPGSP